jgi:ABC-type polysaccharide/polyol phosphate export permease
MSNALYTEAHPRSVARVLPDLIRARELLLDLVWKDLRVRYRYAAMGFLWAVIEPLVMTLVLTFVFTLLAGAKGGLGRNGLMVLCGYLAWQFFATTLSSATRSLVDNQSLIGKVNFPREVVPLATVGIGIVNLFIGYVLFLAMCIVMWHGPGWGIVLAPALFGIQLVLTVGLSLVFSVLNAFFRDVSYMVGVAVVVGFYGTPVIYPLSFVGDRLPSWVLWLYLFNPMAGLITAYREVLGLHEHTAGLAAAGLPEGGLPLVAVLTAWPVVLALVMLVAGFLVFRRNAADLADVL